MHKMFGMSYKIYWLLRGLLFKAVFGTFTFPGYIGPTCFLNGTRRIHIGKRVRIFPGLRAEAIGDGSIEIGNNVAIEQNVHITAGGSLTIGSNSTIAGMAFITDIDHEYQSYGSSVMDQGLDIKKTAIGENCFIGYGAKIQAGTILGENCIVGAGAVVRGIYPEGCVIVGVPGRVVKRYSVDTGCWERVK